MRSFIIVLLLLFFVVGMSVGQLPPKVDKIDTLYTKVVEGMGVDTLVFLCNVQIPILIVQKTFIDTIGVDSVDTLVVWGSLATGHLVFDRLLTTAPDSESYSIARTQNITWRNAHPALKDYLIVTTNGTGVAFLDSVYVAHEISTHGGVRIMDRPRAGASWSWLSLDSEQPNHNVIQGESGHNLNLSNNLWRNPLTGAWQRFDSTYTYGSILIQMSGGSAGYTVDRDSTRNRILILYNRNASDIDTTLDIVPMIHINFYQKGIVIAGDTTNVGRILPIKALDIRGSAFIRDTIFFGDPTAPTNILDAVSDSVSIRKDSSWTKVTIDTIKIRVADTSDICINGTAWASSYYGSNTADLAFDDDEATYWQMNGATLVAESLKYDLGSSVTKRAVTLRMLPFMIGGTNCAVDSFVLEGSNDDAVWTTVLDDTTENVSGWQSFTTTAPASYRYYMLIINSNKAGAGNTAVYEIELLEDDHNPYFYFDETDSTLHFVNINDLYIGTPTASLFDSIMKAISDTADMLLGAFSDTVHVDSVADVYIYATRNGAYDGYDIGAYSLDPSRNKVTITDTIWHSADRDSAIECVSYTTDSTNIQAFMWYVSWEVPDDFAYFEADSAFCTNWYRSFGLAGVDIVVYKNGTMGSDSVAYEISNGYWSWEDHLCMTALNIHTIWSKLVTNDEMIFRFCVYADVDFVSLLKGFRLRYIRK